MFKDQLGNIINLEKEPMRIVSLVPSQTELLYELGLGDRVVGITKFCIHPNEWFISKERIGGTKDVNIEKVIQLAPDLIIGNKEENTKDDIEALRKIAPVWVTDIYDLKDSLEMITQVSEICNVQKSGLEIIKQIQTNFSALIPFENPPSVVYLIWKDPFMGVGSSTFVDHVLDKHLGMNNVLGNQERYPEIDLNNFPELDYVFLSTEPYPFKEKHFEEIQAYFPKAKIMLVDGEYFTWYGSRLIDAPKYFKRLMKEM
jgi:ABC-type Fe3+-hydroxamate transport system substrate-binding protein